MNMIYDEKGRWFSSGTISIYRHDPIMCARSDAYQIISLNNELAHMQGVEIGSVHIAAVVDDFGSLVRVPA